MVYSLVWYALDIGFIDMVFLLIASGHLARDPNLFRVVVILLLLWLCSGLEITIWEVPFCLFCGQGEIDGMGCNVFFGIKPNYNKGVLGLNWDCDNNSPTKLSKWIFLKRVEVFQLSVEK